MYEVITKYTIAQWNRSDRLLIYYNLQRDDKLCRYIHIRKLRLVGGDKPPCLTVLEIHQSYGSSACSISKIPDHQEHYDPWVNAVMTIEYLNSGDLGRK